MDSGSETYKTDTEPLKSSTPKDCTKASGKTVNFKDKDRLFTRTEPGIKETSAKAKSMAWVF